LCAQPAPVSVLQTLGDVQPVLRFYVVAKLLFYGGPVQVNQRHHRQRQQRTRTKQCVEPDKQPLTAAGLHALRDEYTRTIAPARALAGETLTLEHKLSDLVNQAWKLDMPARGAASEITY